MKGCFSTSGLSCNGKVWLEQPTCLPNAGLASVQLLLQSISRTFGLSTRETLVAVCSALSMVIGPSVMIRGPFGATIPISLQLLVADGGRGNLYGAIDALGQSVIDMFARTIGRRRVVSSVPSSEHEKHLRERKCQLFPLGEIIDRDLARRLAESDGDCAFGSLSYGVALDVFMATSGVDARFLDGFLRAGWNGNMISAVEGQPVYPTVSVLWGADVPDVYDAVRRGILNRLPGLLIARSVFDENDNSIVRPWPDAFRKEWIQIIYGSFVTRVSRLPRHIDPESALVLIFDDDAENEIAAVGSLRERYSEELGASSELLRNAPLQVAKLAGLLTLIQSRPTIDIVTVRFAMEIYRGLLRDSLTVFEKAIDEAPASSSSRRRQILDKLSVLGPLSLKDIIGAYPKVELDGLLPLISEMIREGSVTESGGKFHASLTSMP